MNQLAGPFSFSEALTALKQGQRVARKGWGQQGWVELRRVVDTFHGRALDDLVFYQVIQHEGAEAMHTLWVPTYYDLMADDWHIVD